MSNCNYRLLQLTNPTVGAVAAATLLPLGTITRRINQQNSCVETFGVATNVNNTIYVREPGFYKITYDGFLTAGAAGNIVVNLQINGVTVFTATVTATAAGTVPVSFSFTTRVFDNCCSNSTNLPTQIQLLNSGVALTGGTSNFTVERVYEVC